MRGSALPKLGLAGFSRVASRSEGDGRRECVRLACFRRRSAAELNPPASISAELLSRIDNLFNSGCFAEQAKTAPPAHRHACMV